MKIVKNLALVQLKKQGATILTCAPIEDIEAWSSLFGKIKILQTDIGTLIREGNVLSLDFRNTSDPKLIALVLDKNLFHVRAIANKYSKIELNRVPTNYEKDIFSANLNEFRNGIEVNEINCEGINLQDTIGEICNIFKKHSLKATRLNLKNCGINPNDLKNIADNFNSAHFYFNEMDITGNKIDPVRKDLFKAYITCGGTPIIKGLFEGLKSEEKIEFLCNYLVSEGSDKEDRNKILVVSQPYFSTQEVFNCLKSYKAKTDTNLKSTRDKIIGTELYDTEVNKSVGKDLSEANSSIQISMTGEEAFDNV